MKTKIIKNILGLLTLVLIVGYLGFYFGKRNKELQMYDDSLFNLGNSILMMDAIQSNKIDVVKNMLVASIQGDLSRMVHLYNKNEFNEFDYTRCIVTRKVRAFYEKGLIFGKMDELNKLEYPIDVVISYIQTNCEGKPSQDNNWADPPSTK